MKIYLDIDGEILIRLKRETTRQGQTMSDLVGTALGLFFQTQEPPQPLPPLPSFHSGGYLVDIADREVLRKEMEAG